MGVEGENHKEGIGRGQLCFLAHPGTEIFSGYGLTTQEGRRDRLVGLLMVDRPQPVDPTWLNQVEQTYGDYQLEPMTATGERGILTQMRIDPESVPLLQQLPNAQTGELRQALTPMLEELPAPILKLSWSKEQKMWQSRLWVGLPPALQALFERSGAGCFAAERGDTVTFVTHASSRDIASFRDAQVMWRWELIPMPTAPLIRFRGAILDDPNAPYFLEHFLNVDDRAQARTLSLLAQQEQITFEFYGDEYEYAYPKQLPQPQRMRVALQKIVRQAIQHYGDIRPERRNFDLAKAMFQQQFSVGGWRHDTKEVNDE